MTEFGARARVEKFKIWRNDSFNFLIFAIFKTNFSLIFVFSSPNLAKKSFRQFEQGQSSSRTSGQEPPAYDAN